MLRALLALAFVMVLGAGSAPAASPITVSPKSTRATPTAAPSAKQAPLPEASGSVAPGEMDRLRAELELKRENAVLQARNELSGAANSRLEIVIGAFGVLITVLAIVFGLSTREAAIARAKEGVDAIRLEMERLRNETRELANEGRTHLEGMRSDRGELRRILDEYRSGEAPQTREERDTITEAAKVAAAKSPQERTADDLKALTIASFVAEDWTAMRDHARAMLYLHADSDDAVLFAQFNLGVALGKLDRAIEAILAYDELIARFGDRTEFSIREQVAKALFNKGVRLGTLGRSEDAIASYDDLLDRCGDSIEPELRKQAARAFLNRGVRLGALGKLQDEIDAYDDIVARFGTSEEPALREQVAKALFNRGCSLARAGKVIEAIEALRKWSDWQGGFDCDKIALDKDFDPVRNRPEFVALLREMGCKQTRRRANLKHID